VYYIPLASLSKDKSKAKGFSGVHGAATDCHRASEAAWGCYHDGGELAEFQKGLDIRAYLLFNTSKILKG